MKDIESLAERGKSMKFRHTLLIVLLLFSLMPLYILGTVMGYENDRNIEDVVKESLSSISRTQIADIQYFCESRKEYMEMIRQYDVVQNEVLISLGKRKYQGEESGEYLDNMLEERVRSNSFVGSISIVDAEFSVVASSTNYYRGEISELRGADKRNLTGDFRFGNVYKRAINDREQRLVAAYDGIYYDGELIGYIVEEILISYFNQYRNSIEEVDGGKMYIMDEKEQYITVGLSKDGKTYKDFVAAKDKADYNKRWNAIDWKNEPSGSFTYMSGGKEHLAYYSDIDYTGWKICIHEDLSTYRERTEKFRTLLFITLGILTAALFIVNIYLSSRLTKPLRRVVDVLANVRKEHNYSLRVGHHSKDEFGMLSREVDELLAFAEAMEAKEQRKQRSLEEEVERDPMTGIYNKKAIGAHLAHLLEMQAACEGDIVVGFVDIDDFRDYNTLYGHQAGDEVICFVANILRKQIGEGVGRNGGDEFLFCLAKQESREAIEQHIKGLLKALNDGFYNKELGETMSVPCSIGVTIAKANEVTQESLIKNADEAMYQTKNNGKNGYSIV